ncbi:MAG: hypothetical protein RL662_111 [Bacteroidota bacterium]|jgi:tetratricopeptide (TPR) repeat protein
MNKEKREILLLEARIYREQGQFADSLGKLHQVVEAFPDNTDYLYLLAATYLEAKNTDAAKDYAEQLLKLNPQYKQSLELLGIIAENNRDYENAEGYYQQALIIDPNFHNARFRLIKLYDEHIHNDVAIEENCRYMLMHRDSDKDSLSMRKKKQILLAWYAFVQDRLIIALAKQGKYKKAIEERLKYINYAMNSDKKMQYMYFINEYNDIYKYYYLSEDFKGLEEFKEQYKQCISSENYKEDFQKLEKDADLSTL